MDTEYDVVIPKTNVVMMKQYMTSRQSNPVVICSNALCGNGIVIV